MSFLFTFIYSIYSTLAHLYGSKLVSSITSLLPKGCGKNFLSIYAKYIKFKFFNSGYRILGWKVFPFGPLKMSLHCLLGCTGSNEKSAVVIFSSVVSFFLWLPSIFSLHPQFSAVWIWYAYMFFCHLFFRIILPCVLWASWIFSLVSIISFGKFLAIISSIPFSLSSSSEILITHSNHLIISHS